MVQKALNVVLVVAIIGGLSACNRSGSGRVLNLRQTALAPDEFLVVPQKPLQTPADLTTLPAPEPGEPDLVTIDFERNLLAALGGTEPSAGAVPARDGAFVDAVRSSGGSTPDIRAVLRDEDQAFREARKGRLARLEKRRQAVSLYEKMLLDAEAEAFRLRSLGVKTPALPVP